MPISHGVNNSMLIAMRNLKDRGEQMGATKKICACCEENKSLGNYYFGVTVQNGERVSICKDCCSKKLIKYSSIIGDKGGFWCLCGELGYPYIDTLYKSAKLAQAQQNTRGSLKTILDYYSMKLKQSGIVYNGFWDSDTMLNDILNKKQNSQVEISNIELMKQRWGHYEETAAYTFLENTFIEYTKDIINMDANLTNRYRDLCKAEYRKRKADESGDVQEIAKAQDNLIKLLNLLKLNDFHSETDERLKFIDRLAWIIEETEPAEEEDQEKYKDIAGYEASFDEIMRSMRNLICNTREYPDIPKEER